MSELPTLVKLKFMGMIRHALAWQFISIPWSWKILKYFPVNKSYFCPVVTNYSISILKFLKDEKDSDEGKMFSVTEYSLSLSHAVLEVWLL